VLHRHCSQLKASPRGGVYTGAPRKQFIESHNLEILDVVKYILDCHFCRTLLNAITFAIRSSFHYLIITTL